MVVVDERRNRLMELVRQRGFASLTELAEALGVSESTVRRDLDWMEESGVGKRTHGGVFYTGSSPQLPHFEERQPAHFELKKAIARRAAELIEPGDSLLLDGGTTTYEVARLLVGRSLQVVTNSLPVANLLASHTATDLILLGGYVYPRSGVTLGPYANDQLAQLTVRKTVLSVAGVNERGFYNSNLLLVETERAMMHAADRVIVVADSTKFGRQSLAHLCPLNSVQTLVVDDHLSQKWRDRIKAVGVELITVKPDEAQDQRSAS